MDSQPQNPNPHTTFQNHKQKRNMERLKKAVFGAMDLDSTTPLSEETKKCIEKRLLQLFPVIRTPDHPPYAAMILDAIKALNEKRGSSEKSLSEFIKSNYDVPWAHSSYLSHHLCKLAQNGDIVVTSDDHYTIPTLDPNPKSRAKEKRQKPKCHRGRGRHGNYHKEAVVEEKNQLGEQEKVEIEELSQAQNHENNVIDEAKEQDCQVNEGKYQSQGQQNEVRPELLQSCPNDDDCATLTVIPVESSSPGVEDEEEESNDDDRATLIVIPVESSSPRVEDEEEESNDDDCATLMVKPVESSSPRVEDEEEESNDDDCATLMVIPVESSSTRVEDEEEESVEMLQKQQKRRKSPFDSLPPLNPQPDFEKQQPQSQHQGRASIPEEDRDTGSLLLPLGPPQHTPSQHRGRGRPPKPQPDTITRDEALVPLQHESYQQHPPQNRGQGRPRRPKPDEETTVGEFLTSRNLRRGRPRKPKPDAEITIGDFSTSQNLRQGRPHKPKPDAEITIEDFSTSRNLRRGRPPKPKPDAEITIEDFSTSQNLRRGRPPKPNSDAETMTGGFSASQNLRRGTRCSKRKPHFDTTMENL